jgi:putative DNA methylase
MTTYRKKLIEVALPLDAINRESAREKSIRHGHPSTLHLWWARRPLAACRAVLFSSLVDDPSSDPAYRKPDGTVDEDAAGAKRAQLFNLIEELVKWENSNDEVVINAARAEIARCVAGRKLELGQLKKTDKLAGGETVWDLVVKGHGDLDALRAGRARPPKPESVNAFLAEHAPPVLDPFCGGGSIPLEAQRLGLRAFASDLNPVPVLITKALIEIPPKFAGRPPVNPESRKHGKFVVQASSLPSEGSRADSRAGKMPAPQFWRGAQGLAEDVRYYGKWMRDEAEKRIGHLYPKVKITAEMTKDRPDLTPYVGQDLTVIAWLWARTVPSPNPAMGGAHVPLARSFWLSTKKGKQAWVEPVIARDGKSYRFTVRTGEPTAAEKKASDAGTKTGRGCKFRCLLSDTPIAEEHIKAGARAGDMGARLMAIVAEGERGRVYLSPIDDHEETAKSADPGDSIGAIHAPLANDPRNLWCLAYGLDHFDKLFTPRQLVALTTFSDLVMEARERVLTDACGAGFQPAAASIAAGTAAPHSASHTAPLGYTFVDPYSTPKAEIASRGELPHLHKEGATYFVTFRLFDAVVPTAPREQPQPGRLHHKSVPGTPPDAIAIAAQYDPPITLGSCALRTSAIAQVVRDALLHFAGERYYLLAWCIMPNHVHVVFAPIGEHTPSDILHSWKSFTSKQANKLLGRTGTFWERESFDHLVRSGADLERFIDYVEHNPVSAGLCPSPEQWPWSSCGAGILPAGVLPAAVDPSIPPASSEKSRLEACTTGTASAAAAYADAVATYLGEAASKTAAFHCTLATWRAKDNKSARAFGRQAIPMTWDFTEVNPFADAGGAFDELIDSASKTIGMLPANPPGTVVQQDAASRYTCPRPMVSSDPPYYDNVGYADLSDFYYVWLRRSLANVHPNLFRTLLTPKAEELIASPYRFQGSREAACEFFERGMGKAFERIRDVAEPHYPVTIYYAFKQAETDDDEGSNEGDTDSHSGTTASTGWETMLEGLIHAGFSVTGTWPMHTESTVGLKNVLNALASSIVLVCHPRTSDSAMTTRKDFVAALKKELPRALRDLQSGNIAPVDLAQAAIGPGMAIYSRYAKVVNSDGSRMPVRTALQLINQALDEVLSELESEFDPDTRWAIKWFEQHAHDDGPFGDAETLSKAMAVSVTGLKDAGLVKAGQGKVRLLRRAELAADWDPATDQRLTIWEVTQHLIRRLEAGGDAGAAELLRQVGALGEVARDLAYRLYSTCERKKWAEEARSYNGLVVAWPEIVRLSREQRGKGAGPQAEMGFT